MFFNKRWLQRNKSEQAALGTLFMLTVPLTLPLSASAANEQLQLTKQQYGKHESVEVYYQGEPGQKYWVGIFERGAVKDRCSKKNKKFLVRRFVQADTTSGTVKLHGIEKAGQFELQMFTGKSRCPIQADPIPFTVADYRVQTRRLANSGASTHGASTGDERVNRSIGAIQGDAITEVTVTPNDDRFTVRVFYENSEHKDDWVGLYPTSMTINSCESFDYDAGDWGYAKSSDGRVKFKDVDAGDYRAYFFEEDEYCVTSSVSVSVGSEGNGDSDNGGSDSGGSDSGGSDNGGSDNGGSDNGGSDNGGSANSGSLSVSKSEYSQGETVVVDFPVSTEASQDWLGVYSAQMNIKHCEEFDWRAGDWQYTNDDSGQMRLNQLAAGEYQAIVFQNDGYCFRDNMRVTFTVNGNGGSGGNNGNGGGNNGGGDNGGSSSGAIEVTLNPYANANWNSQRKGNFHTHTTWSDGDISPNSVTRAYADADYDVLAITDHSYDHLGATPANSNGMQLIPGNELSGCSRHVNALFQVPRVDECDEDAISETHSEGGISLYNHPARNFDEGDYARFANYRRRFSSHVGIEVFNRTSDHALRNGLWDNINRDLFIQNGDNLLYWGFANDDMHSSSEYFKSFQFMLGSNIRSTMERGAFYFCRGNGRRSGPISNISVSNSGVTISGGRSVNWKVITANGVTNAGSGSHFDFSNIREDVLIRAEVEGDNMTCYTQPIGLRYRD